MYVGLHVTYPLLLSDFNEARIFSTDFRKKILKYQISWKSVPVGAELFHADGQTDTTDMTKLIVAFRNFAKRA
jgi:hypothetical protein